MKAFGINLVLLLLMVIIAHSMTGAKIQETRKRVVVIDSGIMDIQKYKDVLCVDGHVNTTSKRPYNLQDNHGHGTNVVSIIAEGINNKTHCITVIKGIEPSVTTYESTGFVLAALQETLKLNNVAYLNLSLGGLNPEMLEYTLIDLLMRKGVVVSAAAGNEGNKRMDLKCTYFPACSFKHHKQFRVVTSHNVVANEGIDMGYNYEVFCGGTPRMCGTSQATAFYTKRLLMGGL